MAHLDDVYVVARRKCGTSGVRPDGCDILQRIAVQSDPNAIVWRSSDVPTQQQRIKILGTPLGHHDFVQNHLERVADEHQQFLDLLPTVPNLQSSWLLLVHCASSDGRTVCCALCARTVCRGLLRRMTGCVSALLNIPVLQERSTRDKL